MSVPTLAPREGTIPVRPSPTIGFGILGVLVCAAVTLGFVVTGLVGRGHDPAPAVPAPAPVGAAAATPDPAVATTRPVRLRIPAIDVDTRLMSLGLTARRELEVPPLSRAGIAGWYRLSPAPGDVGPAVVAGHVDTRSGPAVFQRLHELEPGDRIEVARSDGQEAVFVVDRVGRFAKKEFPTRRVYGPTADPQLRLITCGGVFDRTTGHYVDNVVVFAHIASLAAAGGHTTQEQP